MQVLFKKKKRHIDRVIRCYLTLDCNGGCDYCSAGVPSISREVRRYVQPPEVWANGINRRARECILAGGEPFLYPRLAELVNMITVRVQLYTNLKFDVNGFLSDSKRTLSILASFHEMNASERILWLKNAKSMIDAGHHVRFHVVKVGDWPERIEFIRDNGITNQITACDDQRSGVKSGGREANDLMPVVSCSNSIYLFGPDGYRYPCVTLMGKGKMRQEHISDVDSGDTITVSNCRLFGLCVGCDNNIQGEVISKGE